MSTDQQNELVANYIMANVPGEPSRSEGAGECAVRLLAKYRTALIEIMSELGVPGEGYPMPVANAYEIAKQTLEAPPWDEVGQLGLLDSERSAPAADCP